jgi:hypothetical protein
MPSALKLHSGRVLGLKHFAQYLIARRLAELGRDYRVL